VGPVADNKDKRRLQVGDCVVAKETPPEAAVKATAKAASDDDGDDVEAAASSATTTTDGDKRPWLAGRVVFVVADVAHIWFESEAHSECDVPACDIRYAPRRADDYDKLGLPDDAKEVYIPLKDVDEDVVDTDSEAADSLSENIRRLCCASLSTGAASMYTLQLLVYLSVGAVLGSLVYIAVYLGANYNTSTAASMFFAGMIYYCGFLLICCTWFNRWQPIHTMHDLLGYMILLSMSCFVMFQLYGNSNISSYMTFRATGVLWMTVSLVPFYFFAGDRTKYGRRQVNLVKHGGQGSVEDLIHVPVVPRRGLLALLGISASPEELIEKSKALARRASGAGTNGDGGFTANIARDDVLWLLSLVPYIVFVVLSWTQTFDTSTESSVSQRAPLVLFVVSVVNEVTMRTLLSETYTVCGLIVVSRYLVVLMGAHLWLMSAVIVLLITASFHTSQIISLYLPTPGGMVSTIYSAMSDMTNKEEANRRESLQTKESYKSSVKMAKEDNNNLKKMDIPPEHEPDKDEASAFLSSVNIEEGRCKDTQWAEKNAQFRAQFVSFLVLQLAIAVSIIIGILSTTKDALYLYPIQSSPQAAWGGLLWLSAMTALFCYLVNHCVLTGGFGSMNFLYMMILNRNPADLQKNQQGGDSEGLTVNHDFASLLSDPTKANELLGMSTAGGAAVSDEDRNSQQQQNKQEGTAKANSKPAATPHKMKSSFSFFGDLADLVKPGLDGRSQVGVVVFLAYCSLLGSAFLGGWLAGTYIVVPLAGALPVASASYLHWLAKWENQGCLGFDQDNFNIKKICDVMMKPFKDCREAAAEVRARIAPEIEKEPEIEKGPALDANAINKFTLLPKNLIIKAGQLGGPIKTIPTKEAVKGKIVLIYIAGRWCTYCRDFMPQLKKDYDEIKAMGLPFEIVWLTVDRQERDFDEWYAEDHGRWPAVSYNDAGEDSPLAKAFYNNNGREAVPRVVYLDTKGAILEVGGRGGITPRVIGFCKNNMSTDDDVDATEEEDATEEKVVAEVVAEEPPVTEVVAEDPPATVGKAVWLSTVSSLKEFTAWVLTGDSLQFSMLNLLLALLVCLAFPMAYIALSIGLWLVSAALTGMAITRWRVVCSLDKPCLTLLGLSWLPTLAWSIGIGLSASTFGFTSPNSSFRVLMLLVLVVVLATALQVAVVTYFVWADLLLMYPLKKVMVVAAPTNNAGTGDGDVESAAPTTRTPPADSSVKSSGKLVIPCGKELTVTMYSPLAIGDNRPGFPATVIIALVAFIVSTVLGCGVFLACYKAYRAYGVGMLLLTLYLCGWVYTKSGLLILHNSREPSSQEKKMSSTFMRVMGPLLVIAVACGVIIAIYPEYTLWYLSMGWFALCLLALLQGVREEIMTADLKVPTPHSYYPVYAIKHEGGRGKNVVDDSANSSSIFMFLAMLSVWSLWAAQMVEPEEMGILMFVLSVVAGAMYHKCNSEGILLATLRSEVTPEIAHVAIDVSIKSLYGLDDYPAAAFAPRKAAMMSILGMKSRPAKRAPSKIANAVSSSDITNSQLSRQVPKEKRQSNLDFVNALVVNRDVMVAYLDKIVDRRCVGALSSWPGLNVVSGLLDSSIRESSGWENLLLDSLVVLNAHMEAISRVSDIDRLVAAAKLHALTMAANNKHVRETELVMFLRNTQPSMSEMSVSDLSHLPPALLNSLSEAFATYKQGADSLLLLRREDAKQKENARVSRQKVKDRERKLEQQREQEKADNEAREEQEKKNREQQDALRASQAERRQKEEEERKQKRADAAAAAAAASLQKKSGDEQEQKRLADNTEAKEKDIQRKADEERAAADAITKQLEADEMSELVQEQRKGEAERAKILEKESSELLVVGYRGKIKTQGKKPVTFKQELQSILKSIECGKSCNIPCEGFPEWKHAYPKRWCDPEFGLSCFGTRVINQAEGYDNFGILTAANLNNNLPKGRHLSTRRADTIIPGCTSRLEDGSVFVRILISFYTCFIVVSLSLLSIYYCLPAFYDTT
jgi:hypothetical protein